VFLKTVSCCGLVMTAVLSAAAQPKSLAVTTPADFHISGTLVDANTGQPIARARVAVAPVTQRDNFTTVITREDGRFLFASLMPGKYTLTAQARGYLVQSFNQHDQFASSVVVGPDLDSGNLLFRLSREGNISGVVSDEAGEPVRDAQVMLYFTGLSAGADATRPRGRTVTNDEGAYHFGHLLPGRYLVAVSARPWYAQHPMPRSGNGISGSGSISAETGRSDSIPTDGTDSPQLDVAYPVTFFPGVTEAGAATPIALGRGDTVTADINLQPVPALHIRVNTDKGDADRATRIALQVRVLDGPPIQVMMQTRGVREGEEEIVGVAPGHYTMTSYAVNRGGPSTESSPAREIDINSSGDITSYPGITYVPVTAKVQFDSAAPSGQVYLQLLNKKSGAISTERVGSDDELAFRQGVLPGSYEVSLSRSSGVYLKSVTAAGATVNGRTLEIRPGSTVELTINAVRGQGTIAGTALREGKPLAGAMIVLVPADPAHNQVLFRRDQSDSDGTFTLANVVPGAYTLLAIENGWDLEWMKPEVLKNYLSRGAAVQVQPNGKYDLKVAVQ
jgi:Carboxypeptidase regulatory-like domain